MIWLGVQSPLMEPAAGDSNSETQKVLTGDLKGVLFTAEQLVQTLKEAVLGSKIKKLRGSSEHAFFQSQALLDRQETHTHFSTSTCCGKKKPKQLKTKQNKNS